MNRLQKLQIADWKPNPLKPWLPDIVNRQISGLVDHKRDSFSSKFSQ